jgi:hypothetical protein
MKELTAGEKLALLKDKHNGLKNALKETQAYTYIVYNEDGVILYKSIEEPCMSDYEACKCYKFNSADTKILDENGKSPAQFYIEEDEHEVCHIKMQTTETEKIKSDRDFLQEIEEVDNEADYVVSYTDKQWILDIRPGSVLKQNVVFYVTPHKDPHMLLERIVFNFNKVEDNIIAVDRKNEIENEVFSIYTHKSDKITYARK